MPQRSNVLLPLCFPDTKSLRRAAANIIRDIQREHEETDQCTADKLGISVGTIRNIRNEAGDIGALTLAKIGAVYGEAAIEPYRALYSGASETEAAPLPQLADALSVLSRASGPKAQLDSLPTLKTAAEALNNYILATERKRLRVVGE